MAEVVGLFSPADEIAAIYDGAPVGLAVLDMSGRYRRVNKRLAEINGVSVEAHIGRTVAEVIPDVAANTIGGSRDALMRGQAVTCLEFQAETPAQPGVRRAFRMNLVPLFDGNGQPAGVSVSVEELTTIRETEAEAARLSTLLRTIGETTPDLIFAKDRGGRMLYANPATCAVIGHPLEEIVGRRDDEWSVNLNEARAILAVDERIMISGEQEIAEEPYTSPDGTHRVFRSAKTPMVDASGRVVGIAGVSTDITAIRASERALRQSETRLRMSLEAARMVAWELDLATGQARRSRSAAELFGIEDGSADSFLALIHPDDRSRVQLGTERAISGIGDFDEEYRLCLADGRTIWVADRAEVRRGSDGQPAKMVGVVLDVTARKTAEAAAAQAAADFEALAENVNQLVWIADAEGSISWFNKRWYNYTGTTPAEMRGWGWQAVHHPDHADRVVAKWSDHIRRGLPWEDLFPLRGADGQYRWFLSRAEPIRGEGGAILRWFGTNTDVTEQLGTAEALRQSEALFRTTAEALPGLLFVATSERGNIYVNEEYRRYTGRAEAELLGWGYIDLAHPEDRSRMQAAWNQAVADTSLYSGEFRLARSDGAYRWHLVRGLPVRGADGEVERWVGTCIDIHERRLAEEELQHRIEAAIAERERAMNQLHEAQKLETLGQLTGGVAHDFNNLLTPIVGSLDLLRRRTEEERAARLIDGALASAERARTLIQRLLAFARRATLQPRAVHPKEVVEGMRELVMRSLGPRIDFIANVAPDLPPALVDPNQLELALLNLSVNARDAMPGGGQLIWTVGAEDVPDGRADLTAGRYVRIDVRDTGIGMNADTLARAVEPFFSTKAAGQGTGLGLSMVHGLAAQSGGAFRLASVTGEGTVCTLWLPVGVAEETPVAVREPDARPAARRALVLLVDDEEQVRFTTSESLKELGYAVIDCESGQQALDRVADGLIPDLLVTDQLMPGMTGAQLALEMRRSLPDLPVLMITGYAQLRPEESGDFEVLFKPYRHAELALRIADVLAEQPVMQRALS